MGKDSNIKSFELGEYKIIIKDEMEIFFSEDKNKFLVVSLIDREYLVTGEVGENGILVRPGWNSIYRFKDNELYVDFNIID